MAVPTYKELADAVASNDFINRCTIAVIKYAKYILTENPATESHQKRYNWAVGAVSNPGGVVGSLKWSIIYDGIFTSQDPLNVPGTSDANITAAVEATINTTVLTF